MNKIPEYYFSKAEEDLETLGYNCEKSDYNLTVYIQDLLYQIDRHKASLEDIKKIIKRK